MKLPIKNIILVILGLSTVAASTLTVVKTLKANDLEKELLKIKESNTQFIEEKKSLEKEKNDLLEKVSQLETKVNELETNISELQNVEEPNNEIKEDVQTTKKQTSQPSTSTPQSQTTPQNQTPSQEDIQEMVQNAVNEELEKREQETTSIIIEDLPSAPISPVEDSNVKNVPDSYEPNVPDSYNNEDIIYYN